MRHRQRRAGAELDGEIAIRHRVERVLAHAVETQFTGDALAIDRVSGAGHRRRAQRQHVEPPAAIAKARGVTLHHLEVGQQVMRETHRLRHLQMRVAGHERIDVMLGQIEQAFLEGVNQRNDLIRGPAQIEPDVGCDLVVA